MNILCIAPSTPIPISGGRRHVYQVLKYLANRNTIDLIATEDKSISESISSKYTLNFLHSFHKCTIRYTSSKKEKFLSIIGLWSEFKRFNIKELSQLINHAFQTTNPDIIIIQELCMVEPTLKSLAEFNSLENIPVVCVAHNDEANLVQSKGSEKNPVIRFMYKLAFKSAKRYQSAWLSKVNAIVCLTLEDYSSIQQIISKESMKYLLFGNGVDTSQFTSNLPKLQNSHSNSILFMGDYTYPPNLQSIVWFINLVLPHIKQKLVLIGLPPEKKYVELFTSNPKIDFKGLVDNVVPHIAKADICIAPILSGSGSRLKILEYLSMQKIVFSTTLGVQGLQLESNKHYLECNKSEDFINNCNNFSLNPDQYFELGLNGRAFVEENWDWNQLIPKFELFLEDLIQSPSKNI